VRSATERFTVEIIKRSDVAESFVVLPRRRVVERTFAGLTFAAVKLITRRLVRG
jgi:transposase